MRKLDVGIDKDVLQKWEDTCQKQGLVGIHDRCKHIEALLQKFPVVGIWGMGGIGKTTIAKLVFKKLSSQYDICCFLENVREESQRKGLNQLRDEFFYKLLENDIMSINSHKAIGLQHAMRKLNRKKVFIVLDDVDDFVQLEYLVQDCNFLGSKSRVIITTRDKQLLKSLRVKHEIYEVNGLSDNESFELFKLKAFNEDYPEIGYEDLTKKFVSYAKGTPLALNILGSFLRSKSREEWKSAWKKLKKIPNEGIDKVLRLSYDGLNYEEQQIFLDIACFLKGENKEKVISFLDSCDFCGSIGLRILQDRTLITLSYENIVQMHDLIQQIGCNIVRKESIKNPEKRSRLCDVEEVYDVLKYNKVSKKIFISPKKKCNIIEILANMIQFSYYHYFIFCFSGN